MTILKKYNDKWKEFIEHHSTVGDMRLLLAVAFDEEDIDSLKKIEFISAKWYDYQGTPDGNSEFEVDFEFDDYMYTFSGEYYKNIFYINFELPFNNRDVEEEPLIELFKAFNINEMIDELDAITEEDEKI